MKERDYSTELLETTKSFRFSHPGNINFDQKTQILKSSFGRMMKSSRGSSLSLHSKGYSKISLGVNELTNSIIKDHLFANRSMSKTDIYIQKKSSLYLRSSESRVNTLVTTDRGIYQYQTNYHESFENKMQLEAASSSVKLLSTNRLKLNSPEKNFKFENKQNRIKVIGVSTKNQQVKRTRLFNNLATIHC
jgi:hypothetical protein